MFSIPCRPCLSISARGLFCRIFFVQSIHKSRKHPPIYLFFPKNLFSASRLPGGDFLFSTYFTKSICIAYYLRRFHSLLISSRPPRRRRGEGPARQRAVLFPPENRQNPAAAALPSFRRPFCRPQRALPATAPLPAPPARQNRPRPRGRY